MDEVVYSCSQCGCDICGATHGYSHCRDHIGINIDRENVYVFLENAKGEDLEFVINEFCSALDYIGGNHQNEKKVAQAFDTFCSEISEKQKQIEDVQGGCYE